MKELKDMKVTMTQEPKTFRDKEANKDVNYMEYAISVNGRKIVVKGSNPRSKVFLEDLFENVKVG